MKGMIPMQMGKELAEQHVADLGLMASQARHESRPASTQAATRPAAVPRTRLNSSRVYRRLQSWWRPIVGPAPSGAPGPS